MGWSVGGGADVCGLLSDSLLYPAGSGPNHPIQPAGMSQVCRLKTLDKLYVQDNLLRTLPPELHTLSTTLTLLSATGNPLENELIHAYLHGLPALMEYFKTKKRQQARRGHTGSKTPLRPCARVDLFAMQLPCYHSNQADAPLVRPQTAPVVSTSTFEY